MSSRVPRSDTGRWCVYVVRCRDGTLYTGITNDLLRRLARHDGGTAARYTRSRGPVTLLYREAAADRSAALRREAAIKRLTRAAKLALVRGSVLRPAGGLGRAPRTRRAARARGQ